jgi:hypothetical protein
MSRDIQVAGATMVWVKGAAGTSIASLSELGLPDSPIRITPDFRYLDVTADAWGEAPFEVQYKLASVYISMRLVHVDLSILDTCLQESQGGSAGPGLMTYAGSRLGNNAARFAATNHFIGLNIAAPVNGRPWRFFFAYLVGPPIVHPLGTERSLIDLNWRAIPYIADPWNAGLGSATAPLFDHTLDT